MDDSAARGSPANAGVVQALARASGARAGMAVLPPGAELAAHTHDFPYLSLHLLGAYEEEGDGGRARIDGPSAAFHPAGASHGDRIGPAGLTTVVIEFEPGWLARATGGQTPQASVYWRGGVVGRAAASLARACLEVGPAWPLRRAARFLVQALEAPRDPPPPAWLARLDALADLRADPDDPGSTQALAAQLRVSAPWLARAYRATRGEGLAETHRRRRVERAVRLLEDGDLPLAAVALDAGFCDQSHMNRAFRSVLRRTPGEVRHARRGGPSSLALAGGVA